MPLARLRRSQPSNRTVWAGYLSAKCQSLHVFTCVMCVCVVSPCDFAYLYVPRTQCANRQQQSKVNNQIAEWAEKNIIHAFICGHGVLLELWSVQRCCCCCCCCVGDDSLGNSIRCFLNLFQSLYNSNIIFVLFLFSISQNFRFDQLTLASCVADDNRFTLYAWLSRCCRVICFG